MPSVNYMLAAHETSRSTIAGISLKHATHSGREGSGYSCATTSNWIQLPLKAPHRTYLLDFSRGAPNRSRAVEVVGPADSIHLNEVVRQHHGIELKALFRSLWIVQHRSSRNNGGLGVKTESRGVHVVYWGSSKRLLA